MENTQATDEAGAALPLFYKQPEVLEANRHAGMGLGAHDGFGFTSEANAIPINVSEFARAAPWFPIVFAGDEKLAPVAVVGLRKGQNLFVREDGGWESGAYVPAYLRRYPFILTKPDAEKDQVLLCVDRAASRFTDEEPHTPFFENNETTEMTKSALEFCLNFQRHALATEKLVEELKAADLLVPQQGAVELPDGEKLRLTDFKVIEEKRLNELPDEKFLELRKSGALSVAYCQLVSMNSWQRLTQMAAARK